MPPDPGRIKSAVPNSNNQAKGQAEAAPCRNSLQNLVLRRWARYFRLLQLRVHSLEFNPPVIPDPSFGQIKRQNCTRQARKQSSRALMVNTQRTSPHSLLWHATTLPDPVGYWCGLVQTPTGSIGRRCASAVEPQQGGINLRLVRVVPAIEFANRFCEAGEPETSHLRQHSRIVAAVFRTQAGLADRDLRIAF